MKDSQISIRRAIERIRATCPEGTITGYDYNFFILITFKENKLRWAVRLLMKAWESMSPKAQDEFIDKKIAQWEEIKSKKANNPRQHQVVEEISTTGQLINQLHLAVQHQNTEQKGEVCRQM